MILLMVLLDIKAKKIKAVGTPIERFSEDGLRAFKACRLAAQLDFDIEPDTYEAIKKSIPEARYLWSVLGMSL